MEQGPPHAADPGRKPDMGATGWGSFAPGTSP